jgi:hypothetical protein
MNLNQDRMQGTKLEVRALFLARKSCLAFYVHATIKTTK